MRICSSRRTWATTSTGSAQAHDRIADELAGTVPGDLAAAVDVDDGRAVRRPLVRAVRAPAVKTASCSSSSSVSGRAPATTSAWIALERPPSV
jgi:hypothetical protein